MRTNTPAHAHKHTSACTHASTARHCSATAARVAETGRCPRAIRTRGRAADSCSCWFACRLHLVCDALDVARNRPLRTRMWRVKRPAHVLAHVCATARTMDQRVRCSAMESLPSAVQFEHGVHRLLGIRRQSTHAKSRQSSPIGLERLPCWMACRCIARADAPMRSAPVRVRRHLSRRPLRRCL